VWFDRVAKFLTEALEIQVTYKKELAIAIILLYPAFGPSTGPEAKKHFNTQTEISKLLGDDGMEVYKNSITLNNNEGLRDLFFLTPVI